MYIAIIFILQLVAVMLALYGKHNRSLLVFAFSLIAAMFVFYTAMTDVTSIAL